MKEDLGMYGNELNYMQTCWTVGYVLGEIPSNILLTRVRPRYWIPAAEVNHSKCHKDFVVTDSIHSAVMDCFDFQSLKMQHTYPVLRPSVFHWYETIPTAIRRLESSNLAIQVSRRVPFIRGCST